MPQRHETGDDELDGRARDVLREIVLQYIGNGEPISSRSLSRCGRFPLSPASLRNVMADLEDLGYLQQPHTSAGRVPTDRGYRFFITHLMKSRRLTLHEREVIDEQVSQVSELDEVMQSSSRLLSRMSDQVGIVFTPSLNQLTIRSMDFISVSESRILCVIVGTNGVVVNRIVETSLSLTREELGRIGRYISLELGGQSLSEVRRRLSGMTEEEKSKLGSSAAGTIALGIEAVEDVVPSGHELHLEGTTSIFNKPEFGDADAMRKTFLALEEKEKLVEILNQCLNGEGLQTLIGSESRFTGNYNFSIIATHYGSVASPLGLVGIIGPTRMEYARITPIVDYLGQALTRKIEESEQEQK